MAALTPDQIAAFHRDGFLILDDFFEAPELFEFEDALRRVIAATYHKTGGERDIRGFELDLVMEALEQSDHAYVADVYDTAAQLPAFWRLACKPKIEVVANTLLDRRPFAPLYQYRNRCRIDPPHDDRRTYGWHQEVFYTFPRNIFLQTWSPLIRDTTRENGTIEVCVGSHKEGIAAQTWADVPGRSVQIIVDPEVVARYPQRVVEMKLGQFMIFHPQLFHRSGVNTSREHRYTMTGMYHSVDDPGFRPAHVNLEMKGQSSFDYFVEVMGRERVIGDK